MSAPHGAPVRVGAPDGVVRADSGAVARALWACGRAAVGELGGGSDATAAAVTAAVVHVDPDRDGPALGALAAAHRMTPLVVRALRAVDRVDRLGEAAGPAERLAAAVRAEAQVTVPTLLELAVAPLRAAGVEPVVLKGPGVAERYPEVGLRPMDDLDLLVPRARRARAVRALEDAGWQVRRRSGRDRYDTVLRHPSLPVMPLELHHGLQAFYERATTIDAGALWERRRAAEVAGAACWRPAPEDELVLLAAHAAKPYHVFLRLIWGVDLAVTAWQLDRSSAVDWTLVWRRAAAWRCRTALAVGLLVADRLGAGTKQRVPPSVLAEVPPWAHRVIDQVLSDEWVYGPRQGSTFHLRFAFVDGWWRRLMLAAGAPYQMTWGERLAWPAVAAARTARRVRSLQHAPEDHVPTPS